MKKIDAPILYLSNFIYRNLYERYKDIEPKKKKNKDIEPLKDFYNSVHCSFFTLAKNWKH